MHLNIPIYNGDIDSIAKDKLGALEESVKRSIKSSCESAIINASYLASEFSKVEKFFTEVKKEIDNGNYDSLTETIEELLERSLPVGDEEDDEWEHEFVKYVEESQNSQLKYNTNVFSDSLNLLDLLSWLKELKGKKPKKKN